MGGIFSVAQTQNVVMCGNDKRDNARRHIFSQMNAKVAVWVGLKLHEKLSSRQERQLINEVFSNFNIMVLLYTVGHGLTMHF